MGSKINTMYPAYIKKWRKSWGSNPICTHCRKPIEEGDTFTSTISGGVVRSLHCIECAERLNIV